MKITLSHTEKVDIIPDSAVVSIRIECHAVDHATSTSRVNLRQNEILENLDPLGIQSEHLLLVSHATSFDEYKKEPEKARAKRELLLKLRHPTSDLIRQILDRLAFDHDEVTSALAWKITHSDFRHELLKSAMTSLQNLADASAPGGGAKALEIQADDSLSGMRRRNSGGDVSGVQFCKIAPKLIEHESAAIEPSPIRYSLKLTGTFEIA